jgi:hypothetical protein
MQRTGRGKRRENKKEANGKEKKMVVEEKYILEKII